MPLLAEGDTFEDREWYIMIGENSNEPNTYQGFVLIHDNPHEMKFLFNHGVKKIVPLPKSMRNDLLMSIKVHPQINGIIRFPLQKKDFQKRTG